MPQLNFPQYEREALELLRREDSMDYAPAFSKSGTILAPTSVSWTLVAGFH